MTDLVLIAEDERDILELLEYNLKCEGFNTHTVMRGDLVIDEVKRQKPSLLLLDIMMPGMTGIEVCKRLRAQESTAKLPIIMITAKGSESDKVVGLELGADDYVVKPFSTKEVVARVKALLRRVQSASGDIQKGVLRAHDVRLDVSSHKVFVEDEELSLTLTEFKLLKELMQHMGQVLSRQHLMEKVIGNDVSVTDRTIDVHLASLRKKMKNSADLVETVRGIGYRFKE